MYRKQPQDQIFNLDIYSYYFLGTKEGAVTWSRSVCLLIHSDRITSQLGIVRLEQKS
jgi:hypothetical protein